MIKFWIEKRNLSWLRLAGILVVISFLFSSLSAPFVEASFWQERREAVENLKDSQTINSSTTEPIQLASAIGLTPFQTNALFPLSQSQIPTNTINQVLEKVKQRSHANAAIHTKHKFQEIPSELVNRLEPYGKIERVNIAKGQELRLKAGQISVGVFGKKESAEVMVSDISSLPLVIHIQDAHDIYSAQKNITLMINELTGLGAGIVGVEGAEGKIEGIERWGRYSGRESVMGVAGYLLKEGLLTGVEAAGLSQRLRERESSLIKRVEFYGVEDQKKYQEQVKAFKETLKSNEEVDRWMKEAGEAITKLKEQVYSDELRGLDRKKEGYEKGELKLGEWVKSLWEAGDKQQSINLQEKNSKSQFLITQLQSNTNKSLQQLQSPKSSDRNFQFANYALQYPNLHKYINAYEIEKKLVFKEVEKEQKKLLEGLSNRLNKQELMELLEESLAYRLGSIGYWEFYGYLRRRCEKAGIVITPEMKSYIEYLLLVEGIVQEKLFKELKELEEEVWNKSLWISGLGSGERSKNLTRSGILNSDHDQRNLYEIVNDYRLLVKAIAFKLSVEDWEEYTKRVEELETIGERINRLDATGNGVSALTLELKKVLRNVERFNELSHERNQIFVDKLVARMGERETHSLANLISSRQVKTRHGKADNNISILVSGGYHTKGIEELLRKKGISFITVRPNLNGDDIQKDYHPLYSFKRDLLPLEKMFLPEKVTLAPELAAVNVNSIKGQTAQGILRAAPVVLAELEGKGNLKALLKKEKWIKQGKVFTGVVDGVRVAVSKDEKIESLKQELEEAGFDSEEFEYATENPIIEDLDSRRKKRAFAIKKEIPSFLARAATLIRTNSARERAGKIVKFTRRNSVRIYTASGDFVEQKITNPIFAVLDTDANDGTTGGGDNKGLGVASNEISPMQTTVNPSSVVKKRSLLFLVLHAPLFILGAMGMGGGLGAGSVNGGGGKIQKRFITKVFDLLVAIEEYQKLIAKGEGEAFQDWEEFLQLELPNDRAKDEFFELANSIQISEATTLAIVERLCRFVQDEDHFKEFHGVSVKMNKFKGELDQMRRVRRKDQERIALQADRVQARANQSPRLAELMRAGGMKPADVQFLQAAVPYGLMSLARLLDNYYTVLTAEGAVLSFVRSHPPAIGASTGFVGPEAESLVMKYYDALVKVLEFADKMDRDPNARRFADLMAKISADISYGTQMSGGWGNQPLPHSPGENKLYLELAPGTKFIFHMKTELREGMRYHLVDTNYFVVTHLKKLAELFGKRNVEIIQKSVLDLDYPDGSIGTIHGNNFANFMNPSADWWKKACGWLEEGGQIIFTSDPKDIPREKHVVMIRKLYYELVEKEGWSFDYRIGEVRGNDVSKDILDRFVFTKPHQGTRLQSIHTLSDYLKDMAPRVSKGSQRVFLRELYISQRRSVPLTAVGKVLWMFEMHIPQANLEVVKAIESLSGHYQDVIVVLERGPLTLEELRRDKPQITNQIKDVRDLDDSKIRNVLNTYFQKDVSGYSFSHGEDVKDSDSRTIKKHRVELYLYKHPEILAVVEEYPLESALCSLRGEIFLEKAIHSLYIEGNTDKYWEYVLKGVNEANRSLQLRDEALSKKIQDLMNQNPRSLIVVQRGAKHSGIVDIIGEYDNFEKEVRFTVPLEREGSFESLSQDYTSSLNLGQELSLSSMRHLVAIPADLCVNSFFTHLLVNDLISYESFLELYARFENVTEEDIVGLAALIHLNRALFIQNNDSITEEESYRMLMNPILAVFELGWLHNKGYLSQELIAKLPDDVQQEVYEFSSMLANSPQQRAGSSEPEFKSVDAKSSLIAGTISFAVGVIAVLAHSWILQKFGPLPNLIIFILAAALLSINKRRSTKHYRWLPFSLEAVFKSVFVVPSIAGFILMTDQGIKIRHALARANKVRDGPEVPSKAELNRLKRSLEELFKEEGTRIVLKDLEDEEKVKGKSVHEIAYVNQDNPEEIKARKIHVDLLAFYYLPDYLRETILRDHEISHLNGSNEIAAYLKQILRSWSNLKKYSKQTKFWRFLTVAGTIFIFLVTLFAVSIYNRITNPFSSPQNLPSLMQPSNVKKATDNIKATKISIDQWITNVMVNTDKNLLIFGEDHTSHRDRALFRSKILPHLKEMGVGLLVIEYVSVDHQPLLDSFNQTGVLPQAIKELSELTSQAAGLPKDEAVQLLHDIHAQGINLVASGSPLRSILRLINLRGHGSKEWFFQEQRDLITDQVLRYRQLYPAEKIVVYGGLLHNDRVPGEVASFLEPAFTVDFLDPLVFRPESFKYDSKTSKSWRFQYEMGVVMGANIAFGLGGDFAAQMSYSELADWILYLGESPTALNPLPVSTPFPTPTPIASLVPQVYPTGLAPQASPKSPISTNAPAQRIVWFFERHSQESSSKLVKKIEDELLNKHKEIYLFLEQAAPMLGDITGYFFRRGILLDSEESLNDPRVVSALESYLKERVWSVFPEIIADFRSGNKSVEQIVSDPNAPRISLYKYLAERPQIQIFSEQPPIEAFLAQLRSDFALDRALIALYDQGDEKQFFKEMTTYYKQAFLSKKLRDEAIAKILQDHISKYPHAAILVNIGSGHANVAKMVSLNSDVKTEKFLPTIDNQEPYDIINERYGKAILSGRQIPVKARKLLLANLPLSVLIKNIPSHDLTDLKQATDIVLRKMREKDLALLAKDIRTNGSLLKRAGGDPFVWNNFTTVFILLWLREHDFLPVELQNKLTPAYRNILSEAKSLEDFLKALKIKYRQSFKENDLEKGMANKEQALTANISGNSMLSGLKGLGLSLLPLVLTGAWSPDSTIVYLILSIAGLFAAGLLNFVLFSEKKRLSLSPFSKIVMRGVIVLLTVNGLQAVFNIKELNGYIFAGFLGLAFLMDRYIKYRLEFNSGIARVKNLMNKGSFWKALNAAEELAPKAKSLKDYYMLSKFFSEIGVKLNIERNRDFSLQAFENAIRMAKRVMELKFSNKSRSFFADVKFQSTKDGHLKYENSFEFLVRDLTKSARVDILFEEAKKEHPDYQYEAYLLIWQELYRNIGQFALEEMAFHEAIATAETTNVSNPYLLILETLWRETNGSLNAVFNFVSSSLDPALVSIRFGEAFYRLGEEEKDKKYFQELAKLSFEKAEGFIELAQDPLVQSRYYDLLAATLVNLYSIEETYRIMTKKGTTKVSIGVFDSSILQLAEKIALKRSPDYLQKVHQGEIEEDQKVPLYEEAGQMVSKRLSSAQKIVSGYRKSLLLRLLSQGLSSPSLALSGLGLYALSFSLKAASGSTTDLSFWLAIGGGLLFAGLIGFGIIYLWIHRTISKDEVVETASYEGEERPSSFSRKLLIAGIILVIGLAGTVRAAPYLIREMKQLIHPTQGQLIYSFEFHALDTKDPFVQKIKEAAETHDQVFIVLEQAPPGFNDLAPYLQQFPNAARMLTNLQLLDDPEMQESLEKLSSGFKPKSTDLLYQEWKAGKKQTYAPHLAPVFDYAFRNRGKVHLVAEKSPFESFKAQLKFEIFDQRVRFALYLDLNENLAFDLMNNFYLQTALHVQSRDQALSLILQQLMKDHPYDAIFVRRGIAHDGIIEITGQNPKFQIQNITSINRDQFSGIPMVPALEKYSKELLAGGTIPRTERRLLLSYVPYQALHANFSNPYGVSIETLKRISTIFERMTPEDLERLTRAVQAAYQTINARRYGYGYKRPGKELDLFIIAWLKENKFLPLEIEDQLKPEIRALPISTLDGLINYLHQYGANLDKDLKTNLASTPQKKDIESVSAEVPQPNSLLNKYALAFFAVSPFFTMGMAGVPMSVVVLLSSIKDTASHMVAIVTSLNPWAVGGIIWAVIAVVFLWDIFKIIKKTGSDVGAYGDSHLEGAIVMIMVVGAFIGFVVWNMVGRPYEWFVFLSFITINVAIIIAIVIDQYFKKINGYYTHGWTEISAIDKKGKTKIIYRKPVKTAQIARERLMALSEKRPDPSADNNSRADNIKAKSSPNSKDSSSIERVVKDQDGQSLTEYGIMAGVLAALYILGSKLTAGVPGMGELILATLLLLGGVGFIIYGAILPIFKQMADQKDSGKLKEMEKLEERFNRVKGYLNADETVKAEKELKEIEKLKRRYLSEARVVLNGSMKGDGLNPSMSKGTGFGGRRDKRNKKALNLLAMGVALALVTNPTVAESKVVEDHLRSVIKNELSVNLPVEPILSSTVGEHSQELWDEGKVELSDKIEMNQEDINEFEETAWKVAVLAKWASSKAEYKQQIAITEIGEDLPGATKTFDGTALFSNGVSKQIVEGSILNELRRGGEEKIALTSAHGVSKGKMERAVERLIEKEIDKSLVQSAKDRVVYLSSSNGKRVRISSVISQLKSLGLGELGIQIITDDPLRLEESLQFNIRVKIYKLMSATMVVEFKTLTDVAEEMKEFRFIDINA